MPSHIRPMGGKANKNDDFAILRSGLKRGICYLVSHKYADSQAQLEGWNEKFGFDMPPWWWDAYVHLFIAYFDGKAILPTRFPMACTDTVANQVNLETSELVFESDKSILEKPDQFKRNRPIFSALPPLVTGEKLKKYDPLLFEGFIEQHRQKKFIDSYAQDANASRQGCCQLYARTLIEACGADPTKVKLPKGLSVLSWRNRGRFPFLACGKNRLLREFPTCGKL